MIPWEKIGTVLYSLLWGWPVLGAILLAGANYSFRLGFFQFTHCILWIKNTFCAMFSPRKKGKEGISPFQAVSMALAGSIGTGNIVGVATALTLGGPGAIFWMWVSALLGMMTIFAENVLGIKYRVRGSSGQWQGGAMYYLERGLHSRALGSVFAGACVLASLGMGNMAQSNSIACALEDSFGTDPRLAGLAVAVPLYAVIRGGVTGTARAAEKLVPVMSVGYLLACTLIVFAYRENLFPSLKLIFFGAFDLRAAAGGAGGSAMGAAARYGISRGIFTNEAGLGSSAAAHAGASGTEPAEQGMWGIFQVFVDTMVICTMTALAILCTGVLGSGKDGASLGAEAFRALFGPAGGMFLSLSLILFAFATLLGWSCYGEQSVLYLFGERPLGLFRLFFAAAAFFGGVLDLRTVWSVSDALNGLMAIPNLAALFLLSGEVEAETRSYLERRRKRP